MIDFEAVCQLGPQHNAKVKTRPRNLKGTAPVVSNICSETVYGLTEGARIGTAAHRACSMVRSINMWALR